MDADAVCLHGVPSSERISGVYHGTDTFGLGVGQDMLGIYEVSARQKGGTTDEPSGWAMFVASRIVSAQVFGDV